MNFDIPVREEIMILANAMSDAQRKAMFAKMREGGGGGGSGGTSVYQTGEGDMKPRMIGPSEKAGYDAYKQREQEISNFREKYLSDHPDLQATVKNGVTYFRDGEGNLVATLDAVGFFDNGGGKTLVTSRQQASQENAQSQPSNPNAKYKSYEDWYYNGAWKGGSGWVRTMSPRQMDVMAQTDPGKLRSAIQSEIDKGTYDSYKINGRTPNVDEVISHHIVPSYWKETDRYGSSFTAAGGTISNRVKEEVRLDILKRAVYLANASAMTDEQRKAIFAKMGGGGSGGANRTPVYTMASPTGTIGGSGGKRPSGPLTVSSISEIPQETPNYRMGDMKLADGTVIPGDKLKDYLGAAYNEQSGVINTGLLSETQKRQMGIIKDPMAGAQAVAIQGTPPAAMATPSQRVQQDLNGIGTTTRLPSTPTSASALDVAKAALSGFAEGAAEGARDLVTLKTFRDGLNAVDTAVRDFLSAGDSRLELAMETGRGF